ncbi:MAG TPA: hypothetical protein VEK15_20285 [Vicinamibacteria bacterium]|nr:hypothetical protein [Vicinamibacteria bacterium]
MSYATRTSAMFLVCLMGSGVRCTAEDVRPITNADTVLAIYTKNFGLQSPGTTQLVVAAWGDGRIVWSDDPLEGGPPYRTAAFPSAQLETLLARLDEDGIFDIEELAHPQFGSDSPFTSILVKLGAKRLELRSWHELHEKGSQAIATSRGIVAREGRRRLDVLRSDTPEYLFFRLVWAELRARATSLIPKSGNLVDGHVVIESGALSWREQE